MPVSSRTSRTAVCSGISPRFGPPLGSPVTRLPAGVMTSSCPSRTTTPPYEVSVRWPSRCRRSRGESVDIALERVGVVDRQAAAALGDDAGALEHGEEAAG